MRWCRSPASSRARPSRRAYRRRTPTLAASKGGLKGYATLALGWDRARGLEQIPELVAASERLAQAGVDARTVKFLLDGVPVQRTAALIEPYADKPGYHGELQVDQAVLEQAAVELDAKGFQLHMHTIGDGAVHAAMKPSPRRANATGRASGAT